MPLCSGVYILRIVFCFFQEVEPLCGAVEISLGYDIGLIGFKIHKNLIGYPGLLKLIKQTEAQTKCVHRLFRPA